MCLWFLLSLVITATLLYSRSYESLIEPGYYSFIFLPRHFIYNQMAIFYFLFLLFLRYGTATVTLIGSYSSMVLVMLYLWQFHVIFLKNMHDLNLFNNLLKWNQYMLVKWNWICKGNNIPWSKPRMSTECEKKKSQAEFTNHHPRIYRYSNSFLVTVCKLHQPRTVSFNWFLYAIQDFKPNQSTLDAKLEQRNKQRRKSYRWLNSIIQDFSHIYELFQTCLERVKNK